MGWLLANFSRYQWWGGELFSLGIKGQFLFLFSSVSCAFGLMWLKVRWLDEFEGIICSWLNNYRRKNLEKIKEKEKYVKGV